MISTVSRVLCGSQSRFRGPLKSQCDIRSRYSGWSILTHARKLRRLQRVKSSNSDPLIKFILDRSDDYAIIAIGQICLANLNEKSGSKSWYLDQNLFWKRGNKLLYDMYHMCTQICTMGQLGHIIWKIQKQMHVQRFWVYETSKVSRSWKYWHSVY